MTTRRLLPTVEIANKLQAHLATPQVPLPSGALSKEPAPLITCKDGTSVSIQAGTAWRTTPPRNVGPWETVWMDTTEPPTVEMVKYASGPSSTTYYDVPIHVASHYLLVHGGVDFGGTLTVPLRTDAAALFATGSKPKGVSAVRIEHTLDRVKSAQRIAITVEYHGGMEAAGPFLVTPHEWQKALATALNKGE